MTKHYFVAGLGVAALLLAGCSGSEDPELAIMNDSQEREIPERVKDVGEDMQMQNHTFVGEGEDFSVFAARDGQDAWCILLYNEPSPNNPDDWSVSSSCGTSGDLANGKVWVQGGSSRTHTAQLLPDNYSGEIAEDLERVNDNLAAK